MSEKVSEQWGLLAPSLNNTLWVGGLALLVPVFALAWPGLDREGVELLAYVLLGMVFPMALIGPSDYGLVNFFRGSILSFDRVGHVDSVLVLEEPKEVRELLELAGVKPDEPINTLGIQLLGWIPFKDANGTAVLRSEHPAFLPLQPAWNFYALGSRRHRITKYFERFCGPFPGQRLAADSPQRLRQMDATSPRDHSSPRTNIHQRIRPSGVDEVRQRRSSRGEE